MRSDLRGLIIALGTIAALSLLGTSARAAESEAITVGKTQYMKYCATCHGPTGTGTDGTASKLFTKPPTNLTLLAKNHGGKFPMMEVIGIVRGDQPIAAHGTKEMPIWGQTFGKPLSEGMYGKDAADAQIMNIGQYLETIQVK